MIQINQLVPLNLVEEKNHFFADQTYNPQFLYEENQIGQSLTEYGLPDHQLTELAEKIVKKAYFGRNEAELKALQGKKCSQNQVESTAKAFLKLHHLEERFSIQFSQSFVSRAAITTNTIKFRLPIEYRQEGLIGALYHEIGTHALRRINYEQQPWFKKKKQFGFGNYLETEEGLAVLHSLLSKTFPIAVNTALLYLTSSFAQTHSFTETYHMLSKYMQDRERRWSYVFRQKRGLADTAKPGGFTKDLLYFSGLAKVYHWLKNHQFDPTKLYYGKLSLEDVPKAEQLNPDFQPLLPSFFVSSPLKYAKKIQAIGELNLLD